MYTELTPKQVKALPLLAAGATAAEVSKTLGISQQQMSEWRHDPTFLSALEEARRDALSNAYHALHHLAKEAVQTLLVLLRDAQNEQVRLKAAMYVIDRLDLHNLPSDTQPGTDQPINMNNLLAALGV